MAFSPAYLLFLYLVCLCISSFLPSFSKSLPPPITLFSNSLHYYLLWPCHLPPFLLSALSSTFIPCYFLVYFSFLYPSGLSFYLDTSWERRIPRPTDDSLSLPSPDTIDLSSHPFLSLPSSYLLGSPVSIQFDLSSSLRSLFLSSHSD